MTSLKIAELRTTGDKRENKEFPKFAYGRTSFIRKTLDEMPGPALKVETATRK